VGGVPNPKSGATRSRVVVSLTDAVSVIVRELRLLFGLLLVLFITSETWRYVGRLSVFRTVLFMLATLAVALLVVVTGLRAMLERPVVRRATVRIAVEFISFGLALFVTFVIVGIVSVDAELVAEWSGSPDGVLVSLGIGSPPLVITRQLLQVAAFLGSVGALVFAVEVIADPSARRTLIRDLEEPTDEA
jgi:hypothetical protein